MTGRISTSHSLVITSEDADRIAPEWEALANRVRANPFLRPGWVLSWWHAFGTGHLHALTVRSGHSGRLVALLVVRRQRGALRSPTNWHSPVFGTLSEDVHAHEALLDALAADDARQVALGYINPHESSLLRNAAARTGRLVICRTLARSPYVETTGVWEDYTYTLGKKLRSELRRRRRRLTEAGRVTFQVYDGRRGLKSLLDEGLGVEAAGWKGEANTAIASHPATRRFYVEVARWAASRGWLRLAFLRLNGHALGFDLCLEQEGVHYLLKTGFDPEYGHFAPGKLLRQEMIARAFRERVTSYELLGGEAPWKSEWTATIRPRLLVQLFRSSPLGLFDWAAYAYGRPAVLLAAQTRRRLGSLVGPVSRSSLAQGRALTEAKLWRR